MKVLWGLDPLRFFLGVSAFAWAVGFIRYFGAWVYFPWFPNVLDSIGMGLIGAFLFYEALQKRKPPRST